MQSFEQYDIKIEKAGYYNDGDGYVLIKYPDRKDTKIMQRNCTLSEQQIVEAYAKDQGMSQTECFDLDIALKLKSKKITLEEAKKIYESKDKSSLETLQKEVDFFEKTAKEYFLSVRGDYDYIKKTFRTEPDPKKAEELKKQLIAHIQAGKKIAIEDKSSNSYYFIKSAACEKEYKAFSDAEKQLLESLQSSDVDKMRASLIDGKIPQRVKDYMKYVPAPEHKYSKGILFIDYCEDVLRKSYGARTLQEAEQTSFESYRFHMLPGRVVPFKPEGLEEMLGTKFEEVLDIPGFKGFIYDAYKQLAPEYQEAVVKHVGELAKQSDEDHGSKGFRPRSYPLERVCSTMVDLYLISDGSAKKQAGDFLEQYINTDTFVSKEEKIDMMKKIIDKLPEDQRNNPELQSLIAPKKASRNRFLNNIIMGKKSKRMM